MSPLQWVMRALQQYAVFRGRARRSEFWWFVAFQFLVVIAAAIVFGIVGSIFGAASNFAQLGYSLVALSLFVPALAVAVRRLHDSGKSGWWYLIAFVPLGGIVLLIFLCQDSQPSQNEWGPNPKEYALADQAGNAAYTSR
jgi:uncharacterized membrane protein YhaH (DUF805 family)